jgi:hypothetical protein
MDYELYESLENDYHEMEMELESELIEIEWIETLGYNPGFEV